MTDPNEQALPRPTAVWGHTNTNGVHPIVTEGGLTKREWLAGIICARLIADIATTAAFNAIRKSSAEAAVLQADALIEALNRKPDESA